MQESWLPGVKPIRMTKEPLGTRGELTPGPDELDPEIPEHRQELIERGYLNSEIEDDPDDLPGVDPFQMGKSPLEEEMDVSLPEF